VPQKSCLFIVFLFSRQLHCPWRNPQVQCGHSSRQHQTRGPRRSDQGCQRCNRRRIQCKSDRQRFELLSLAVGNLNIIVVAPNFRQFVIKGIRLGCESDAKPPSCSNWDDRQTVNVSGRFASQYHDSNATGNSGEQRISELRSTDAIRCKCSCWCRRVTTRLNKQLTQNAGNGAVNAMQ